MTRHVTTICIAAALFASAAAHAAERKVTLSVPGMTCPSCPFIIKTALRRVDGVKSIHTSIETRTAVVIYDDALTTLEQLTAATAAVGYKSTVRNGPKPKS